MRNGLLTAVILGTSAAWAWMFWISGPTVRGSLGLLVLAFAIGTAGLFWNYRERLSPKLVTANIALGVLIHATFAALIVAGDRVGELGVIPAISARGGTFVVGVLGLAAAFFTWTRARGLPEKEVLAAPVPTTAPPITVTAVMDWDAAEARLEADPVRQRMVQGLRRGVELVDKDPAAGAAWLQQEARRLTAEGAAASKDGDDVLSQAANLLEWGAQKLPELAELDVSDLLMGKVIADIRAQSDRVERVFVDHRQLLPIHPITRQTAEDKCEARAQSARDALPLLEAHGMRLSEDLIAAEDALEAYRSVTGFQAVYMGEDVGYVTFEGNGRREGLLRAFPDAAVEVEVRHYVFDDPEIQQTIRRRVDRVRRWKGVA